MGATAGSILDWASGRGAWLAALSRMIFMASDRVPGGDDGVQEGVVAVVARDGRLLLIRRAPGVLAGGSWCFVGGAIERGETQSEAVAREFREEVGGRIRPLRKIWEYRRPDGKLLLHWWLAALEEVELRPNLREVAEIRWCTPPEALALPGLLGSNIRFLAEVGGDLAEGDGGR